MKEILVSQEGYEQYLMEIDYLRKIKNNNAKMGSIAYNEAIGDGWHDNFAFEESLREGRNIENRLNKLISEKKYLKIVNSSKKNNVINIGDKLKIKVTYSKDDEEEFDIVLTGKYRPSNDSDITEITLNSPIGKAIYLQDINQNIIANINNKKVKINVLEQKFD